MHDPLTQILHIPGLGILWHKDPERRGSDDSCNWHGYRNNLSADEIAWLQEEGEGEHTFWIRGCLKYDNDDGTLTQNTRGERHPGSMINASNMEIVYAVWHVILWRMPRKGWRGTRPYLRPWAHWLMHRRLRNDIPHLLNMVANGSDNLSPLISDAMAHDDNGKKAMGKLFVAVARIMRGNHRPWYKHPRWHLHHWRLQLFAVQNLKRWAFSKCHVCGKGFRWGESGVGGWYSTGPRWFRSEYIAHMGCAGTGTGEKA